MAEPGSDRQGGERGLGDGQWDRSPQERARTKAWKRVVGYYTKFLGLVPTVTSICEINKYKSDFVCEQKKACFSFFKIYDVKHT